MRAEVRLRMAEEADAPAVIELWTTALAAQQGPAPYLRSEAAALIPARLRSHEAFSRVAIQGDQVVGFVNALAARESGALVPGLVHISLVSVLPRLWGRGIARALLVAVLQDARERGYSQAQLWAVADNRRAIHLYGTLGFEETGEARAGRHGEALRRFALPLGFRGT